MKRRLIALMLAVSLIASMCSTALAAEVQDHDSDGIVNYVSFGASNANGYGLTGYLPEGTTAKDKANANVYGYQKLPEGSYPYLIAATLNDALGGSLNGDGLTDDLREDQPFSNVHVDQLAMSSMRAEELRFLLDETYPGDKYTDWRFYDVLGNGDPREGNWFGKAENNIDTLRSVYENAIANADIITYDMGINNFGVFMNRAMAGSVDVDINAISPEIAAYYDEAKAYVMNAAGDMAPMIASMENMVDALAFTLVGFCTSFDATMAKIYELNPDAVVVVVSIQNLMTDLELQLPDFEQTLPLGELFGLVIKAANTYTAAVSPYSNKYFYANVCEEGRVEFFVDQLLEYDGDPSTLDQDMIDCFVVYDDDLDAKNQITGLVESFLVSNVIKPGLGETVLGYLPTIYDSEDESELLEKFLEDGESNFAQAEATLNAYKDILGGEAVVAGALTAMRDTYNSYIQGRAFYLPLALDMGYDVLAECFQEAVQEYTLDYAGMGTPLKGAIENALLGTIMGLAEQEITKLVDDPTYQFDLDTLYPDGFYEYITEQLAKQLHETVPVSVVKTLACFGVRTGIGNSFYGHPNRNGHEQIADTVLAAIEEDTTGLEVALKEVLALIGEYYDEAYAYAYAEAKAAGYIDTAAAGIDAAIAALKGIDVSATEMTDEFKAELTGEIEEVIETLAAAKALINEADVLDQSSMNALMAMLDEAGEAIENILNLLEQAGADVNELVIVPALNAAYDKLVNEVIPAAEATTKEIAAKAYEYLVALAEQAGEDLAEAYDAFVEAFLEFLPEADAWLYDWFYNNPDKVIAFFEENGEFFVENAEAAATVLGYIANTFGPEALEWVMENPEEALEQFVSWYEKYGERTWAMILVYLEELGVLDCLPTEEDVKAAIEAIEKQIEDCYKQLENATGEALEELEATIEELKAAVEELKAMVEDYAQMLDAAVRAEIEAAIEKLENAVAELETAVEELKAAIEAQIEEAIAKAEAAVKEALAKVEEAIAKVEAAVNGVIADVNETIKEIYAALENAKEELVAGAAQIVENLKDALADLYDVIVENADKIDDAVLAEIIAAIEDIEDALEKLDAIIKGAADAAIEDVAAELKSALAELQDAVEALIEAVEDNADEIIEEAVAAFEQAYLDATTDEYTITKDSYYVAIGDETVLAEPSYADMLAEALEVEYTKIGEEGLTVAGTEAVLMQNIAEIVKADLITLGYSNNTMISFMIDQATSLMPEELDWSVYGYDELGEYVDAALTDITEELYAQGLDAQTAGLMVTAIESYAYAYTTYIAGYPVVVDAIHEINPEALVIMVGMNNALADVTLEAEGVEFAIGEYVEYLVDAANIESLAYAMLTGNAIYVDAPAVETMLEAYDVELGTDMITVLQLLAFPQNRALLNPSEAGHDYIKEQILNALELDYEYLLGDVNLDGEVNSIDTNLLFRFVMKKLPEGFTALQMWAGDVNEDGEVNSIDTDLLFRYVMKRIPALGAQAQ